MANVYVASNKIEVFPSGFRGTGYTQSLYTSEKNLTSLVGKISKHSNNNCFCIEDPDYPTYTIIGINGYVFRLLTSDIPNNVTTAYIKLRDTSNPDYGKVLDNINSTGNTLDIDNVFYGLAFTSDAHSYSATEPCVTLASSKFRLSTDEIKNGETISSIDEMFTTDVLNITSNGSINLGSKIKMYANNGDIYTAGELKLPKATFLDSTYGGIEVGSINYNTSDAVLDITSTTGLNINATSALTITSGATTKINNTIIPKDKTLLTTEGGTITSPSMAGGLGIQAQSAGILWLQSSNTYLYGENNNLYIHNDNSNGQISIVSDGSTKINNTIIPKNATLATSTDITAEATARQNADNLKFDKTGGTISGNVTIASDKKIYFTSDSEYITGTYDFLNLYAASSIQGYSNNTEVFKVGNGFLLKNRESGSEINEQTEDGIKFINSVGASYNKTYYKLPTDGSTSSSAPDTIATKEWVNNNCVHKTGNETISGLKTFSTGINTSNFSITSFGQFSGDLFKIDDTRISDFIDTSSSNKLYIYTSSEMTAPMELYTHDSISVHINYILTPSYAREIGGQYKKTRLFEISCHIEGLDILSASSNKCRIYYKDLLEMIQKYQGQFTPEYFTNADLIKQSASINANTVFNNSNNFYQVSSIVNIYGNTMDAKTSDEPYFIIYSEGKYTSATPKSNGLDFTVRFAVYRG